MILLAINKVVPPLRRVKMNGSMEVEFPLQSGYQDSQDKSGVAQGDPISPLMFLLVGKVMTIMIAEDSCLQGMKIVQKEHRISQFADDTLFILKG
eukprot:3377371-Pleurochrysis_carterae.AAC.2